MPWRLYRYMLADLCRTVGLTVTVLVTVIAFGATIKPLSHDNLLNAAQIAKYLVLVTVPMLQFALPFAAGFGATLTLNRMTNDNEILAASATGISYRRLLAPILGLGLTLTMAMVGLTQWIIPQFWGILESAIAHDVTAVFQASLDRGEPFRMGDLQIYADRLRVEEHPQETGADTRLRLWGVAAAETDDDGRISTQATAEQAVVDVYRRDDGTWLKMVLLNVVYSVDSGTMAGTARLEPDAFHLPRPFLDDPRAMTQPELVKILHDPDSFGQVTEKRLRFAARLAEIRMLDWIDESLRRDGGVVLDDPGFDGRYVIQADRFSKGRLSTRDRRPVVITRIRHDVALEEMTTTRAELGFGARDPLAGPTDGRALELTLRDFDVRDLEEGGEPNRRAEITFPNLLATGAPVESLSGLSSDALVELAAQTPTNRSELDRFAQRLYKEITDLRLEVLGRLWKRYAMSMTAMLLFTFGAALAMLLRESLPLTIYLWSFVPAVGDLILISGGEQAMREGHIIPGLLAMWSGNFILVFLLVLIYRRLNRN